MHTFISNSNIKETLMIKRKKRGNNERDVIGIGKKAINFWMHTLI